MVHNTNESSSRRNNRINTKDGKQKGCELRRRSRNSNPSNGIYSPDEFESSYSTSTCEKTRKTSFTEEQYVTNSDYDSMEEYQVTFPTVELKLPRQRRHHRSKSIVPVEHVTMTKSVNRRQVSQNSDNKSSISEYSTYTYSTHLDRSLLQSPDICTDRTAVSKTGSVASNATYRTYNSQHRLQSIGNFFTSIVDFFRNNPKFTKFIFGIVLCYVIVCNLEIFIPRVITIFVRLCYPWARYWVVVAEQFSSAVANMFTRMDAIIYASYCEFAAKYCRSRRLMCDVTCSFVDHVLSQARPTLTPIPQN